MPTALLYLLKGEGPFQTCGPVSAKKTKSRSFNSHLKEFNLCKILVLKVILQIIMIVILITKNNINNGKSSNTSKD